MAVTKGSGAALLTAVTSTQTSSPVVATGDYATDVFIRIVVVGTPTVAATVQILVSPDGGTTYYAPPSLLVTTPLVAGTYDWVLSLPPSTTKYEATFTAQTGGTSSTGTVQSNDVTGI